MPELFSDRPDAQQINVGEVQVGLGVEVLIAQIAPAHNGHAVIGQPQLVVHAPVLTRQVEQPPHGSRHAGAAPKLQGIEQPDLHIGVRRERRQQFVEPVAGRVI